MSTKTEQKPSVFDTLKLMVAGLLMVSSLVAYYYYAEYSQLLRVVGVVVATGLAIGVGMATLPGRNLWSFIQGSRIELRKVVWPTREEAFQTTIAVFVFVLIMAIFFWVLDLLLLWATRTVTGFGGG